MKAVDSLEELKEIELKTLVQLFAYMGYLDKKEFNLEKESLLNLTKKINIYIKKAVF